MAVTTMKFCLSMLLWTLSVTNTSGYSSGEFYNSYPACVDMLPEGHQAAPQTTPSPYILLASASEYQPHANISVVLTSTKGEQTFKGFIVQARSVRDGSKVGEFTVAPGTHQTCYDYGGKTLSHNTDHDKWSVQFHWNPPGIDTGIGAITFMATVVREKNIYWTNVQSAHLSERDTSGYLFPNQNGSDPMQHVDQTGCGSSKGCFIWPQSCQGDTCDSVITWYRTGESLVVWEVESRVTPTQHWLATAVSHTQTMGDSSAVDCVYNESNSKFNVQLSYNYGNTNEVLRSSSRGLDERYSGGSIRDGFIMCRFARYITPNISPPDIYKPFYPNVTDMFNLDQDLYMMLAQGPATNGLKEKHDVSPVVSTMKINVVSPQYSPVKHDVGALVKVHGGLMIMAWMVFCSCGVLMPRYFKPVWPASSLFGRPIWFAIHFPAMVTCTLLALIAFIVIFVEEGGYAHNSSYPQKAHPPLGIVVMTLAIINVCFGIFRPSQISRFRRPFTLGHFLIGVCTHAGAVAAMYLGLLMRPGGLPVLPPEAQWLMVGYIGWHLLAEIILAIHMHVRRHLAKKQSTNAIRLALADNDQEEDYSYRPQRDNRSQMAGSTFITVVCVVHFVGVLMLASGLTAMLVYS